MTFGELAGYIASALVFMTFYMKMMTPLRVIAIMSNVAFVTYASIEGLFPILVLHLCLLPLNILRLRQLLKLTGQVRAAADQEYSFEALLPFMTPERYKAGEVLFHKGDLSHELYYVNHGRVRLPELDKTVGQGETLGEIGLFSLDRTRTMTAVCESDCELLRMPEEKVRQLYYQNPRFGFQLVRIITRRLIENYGRLSRSAGSVDDRVDPMRMEASMAGLENEPSGGHENGEPKAPVKLASRGLSRLTWPVLGVAAVLVVLFISWHATPYVYSLLIRDAAITSWSNIATAPVDGEVRYEGVELNQPVGPGGVVASIRNDHLSRKDYDEAEIQLRLAGDRVEELQSFLEEIEALETDRRNAKALYADMFRDQLDAQIASIEQELATARTQLEVLRKIADRKESLVGTGAMSENEADEAELRVTDLEVEIARLTSDLGDARVRRTGADNGTFVTRDGADPSWVFDSRMDLKLEKKQARLELRNAQAALEMARATFEAAEADFNRLSQGEITIPPGSLVWSRQAGIGATVEAGDPVLEWLDCSQLLVDVPLIDVEVPLLRKGMEARVLLDGEASVRMGRVLMTRGSAATLGRDDLVALSQARQAQHAQVLVDISAERGQFETCPVGRIAYVDFPGIEFIDIVWAWLRF